MKRDAGSEEGREEAKERGRQGTGRQAGDRQAGDRQAGPHVTNAQ